MKKVVKWLLSYASVRTTMSFFLGLFYDKRYLVGRHFEKSLAGWYWAVKGILVQKLLGKNRRVPWPVTAPVHISNYWNIQFHPDDLNNFNACFVYYQGLGGKINIGRGSYIAPNVGLITANHDPDDLDRHMPGKDIIIGDRCWIGMNSVILPGVILGPRTIVGAGSVVTKSFEEGGVTIAGVPARIITQNGSG